MEKADYKAYFGSAKIDFLTVPKQLSAYIPFQETFALFQIGYYIFIRLF